MGSSFEINAKEFDELISAIKNYSGDAEEVINDVLHNTAPPIVEESIRNLIPVSGKHWKGKKPAAKTAKWAKHIKSNLTLTTTTTSNYQYLYFPDDGSSTENHVGNQQFFKRGGEAVQNQIVELCINKLTNEFEN